MEKKQIINCDVYSCKFCDTDLEKCDLREIEIRNQSGLALEKEETICSSYKLDDEKYED